MEDDERLREALLELELLRGREAERLRETGALLAALEAITTSEDTATGMDALLRTIRTSLDCGLTALFEASGDQLTLRFPRTHGLEGATWEAPGLLTRPRRIVDIGRVRGLWNSLPGALENWRSLLSIPLRDDEQVMVLTAFGPEAGTFSSSDADLFERLATITSQAILRRALEQRNAFLAAVIDDAPVSVAIAELTDDMPLVYVNDAFTDLTKFTRDEVIGQNCRFMAVEPPEADTRRAIRKTVEKRQLGDFLVQNRRADGELFWNELRLFPVHGADGNPTHMVATQTDATARLQAEEDRDDARRRLESALGAMSEGILVLGRQGHIRYANATFLEYFPNATLTRDDVLSAADAAIIFGLAATKAAWAYPILKEPTNREVRTQTGRQLTVRARPIPDGGAVIAASDVTQAKVTERTLRQRLAAIEMSQDGIAIGDAEGRIVHANPSLVGLWRLADEAPALGRPWTHFYDPASVGRFEADAARFERTGVWRGEMTANRAGDRRTHDVSLSLVPDVGTVLIAQDVTERLRDAEERNALRLQLDRAQMQERVAQISAGLAHDFNNLLSAIIGSAALIEGLDEQSKVGLDAARRIRKAAEQSADLVDGFLDLGQRERTAEDIDLVRVLRNTVDLAQGGAPETLTLGARAPAGPVTIRASQTDIVQVVMNLIVNGIDAIGGAPGEVRVSLSAPAPAPADLHYALGTPKPGAHYAVITVEDTGAGMPQATVDRILEPYFTTKGNQGTGLGLAVVTSVLTANEALLYVDSQLGRGTAFTVYWPSDADLPQSRARLAKPGGRSGLPLMVLDDAPDVAAAIAAELTAAGFEVAEANEPEIALQAIEEDPDAWGCLVTDYDMPGLSGGDLVEKLALSAPNVPIIVVSALARRLSDRRLDRAEQILSKPVKADKLLAAVRRATGWTEQGERGDADPIG